MIYRPATAADAPTLARMNQQLIRDERHRNPMNFAQLQDRMAARLAAEYQAILFENTDPIGYALYRHESDHVYLRHFFIDPGSRRRGIGAAAFRWLQQNPWKSIPRIRIDVLAANPIGQAFWRSLGFTDYCLTMELAPTN
jgi:GNAT superfamily N-acetyltransferase